MNVQNYREAHFFYTVKCRLALGKQQCCVYLFILLFLMYLIEKDLNLSI